MLVPQRTALRPGQSGGIAVFYIYTDKLKSPTALVQASDNVIVWRWDHDPYGNGLALEEPSGTGTKTVFNLRFLGQYYDEETRLYYNYYRDYDPTVGRYIESDPIGLDTAANVSSGAERSCRRPRSPAPT